MESIIIVILSLKQKILLVDDSEIIRKRLMTILSDLPFVEVAGEATNGNEAIEKVVLLMPDIILLDIMMPKINGFDVLKQLKEDQDTSNIPVIILSALSDEDNKRTGIGLGAAAFIVKSEILPIDIITKIRSVIS